MTVFAQKLIEESKKYDIELTEKMAEKFEEYKNILLEYNKVMNLTAITEDDEIITKHFVDSLIAAKYIKGKKIIDVGTGAGFPGIPLAIYLEDKVEITLLDSLNKRINFLEEVKTKLELNNVTCIHGRAEELACDPKYREKYDIAISRAVAALNVLMEFNSGYVKVNGNLIFMKGSKYKEEIENAKNAEKKLNLNITQKQEYILEEDIMHSIIIAKKIANTPKNYPRSFGKIKKMPL